VKWTRDVGGGGGNNGCRRVIRIVQKLGGGSTRPWRRFLEIRGSEVLFGIAGLYVVVIMNSRGGGLKRPERSRDLWDGRRGCGTVVAIRKIRPCLIVCQRAKKG